MTVTDISAPKWKKMKGKKKKKKSQADFKSSQNFIGFQDL